jgi:hypothetical protein
MATHVLDSTEPKTTKVGPERKRTDGTWHQQQIGLQRWVFLRPNAAYADAVCRDAEDIEYSEPEEVRDMSTGWFACSHIIKLEVKHKLDRVILPLIVCG